MPDAPAGFVKLTIRDGAGVPQVGVKVFFQTGNTLVAMVPTDASGVATASFPNGGYVTAVDPFSTTQPGAKPHGVIQTNLVTFAGVNPGDNLVLDAPAIAPTIQATVIAPNNGASNYFVSGTCFLGNNYGLGIGSGGVVSGPVSTPKCPADKTDMVVTSLDGSNQALGFITVENQSFVDQGVVDISSRSYVSPTTKAINYTNLPSSFSLGPFYSLLTPRGPLLFSNGQGSFGSGSGQFTLPIPPLPTAAVETIASRFLTNDGEQTVIDWRPANTAAYEIDFANTLLQSYLSIPTYDAPSNAIKWTVGPESGAPDFFRAHIQFSRETPSPQSWDWQIAAPGGTQLPLPVLPQEIAQLNPLATDNSFVSTLDAVKVPGGYDAVRGHVHSLENYGVTFTNTGRAVIQTIYRNKDKRRAKRLR